MHKILKLIYSSHKSILIVLVLVYSPSFSQKIFSSKAIVADKEGMLQYSYIENKVSGEYMKDGFYKFISDLKDNYGICKTTIVGNYKKGLKDGNWTYSCVYKDWGSIEMYAKGYGFVTGSISVSCNYNNGVGVGVWVYSSNLKHRAITKYKDGKTIYGGFININHFTLSLSLKNGLYDGMCFYKDGLNETKGSFILGVPNGDFYESNLTSKTMFRFKNGFLYSTLERYSAGEVKYRFPQGPVTERVFEKIAMGQISMSDAEQIHIVFNEKSLADRYDKLSVFQGFDFSKNSEFSFFIEGDLSYKFDESGNLYSERGKSYYSISTTLQSDEQEVFFNSYLLNEGSNNKAMTILNLDSIEQTIKLFGKGRKLVNYLDIKKSSGYKFFKSDINGDLKADVIIQYQFEPTENDFKEYGRSAIIDFGAILIYICDSLNNYKLAYKDQNFTNGESVIDKVENGIIYFNYVKRKFNENETIKLIYSKERLMEQK